MDWMGIPFPLWVYVLPALKRERLSDLIQKLLSSSHVSNKILEKYWIGFMGHSTLASHAHMVALSLSRFAPSPPASSQWTQVVGTTFAPVYLTLSRRSVFGLGLEIQTHPSRNSPNLLNVFYNCTCDG
jgi:hypothetical protein